MPRSRDRFASGSVLLAAALSLLPFLLIAYATWDVYRLVPEVRDQAVAVQELIGRIDYLDEALTSSARLAASTGDLVWAERYYRLDEAVVQAIDSLRTLAVAMDAPTGQVMVQTTADTLKTVETRALELVEAGELDRAWALLNGPAYEEVKAGYLRGREEILGGLRSWARGAEGQLENRLRVIVLLAAISLLFLLVVWGLAIYLVRRQMRKREQAESELRARVAEQQRLETEVRQAEERLRAIMDVAPVAMVRVDRERRVQFWNRAAERMFGWKAEEVLGRPYPLVGPEADEEADRLFREGFDGRTLDGVEIRRRHRDGQAVDLRMWNATVRDEAGEVAGLVGVFADVTEQRQLEQRLRQAEKLEAVGRLAGGIAHDFNNVMTAVRGHADLMLEELRPDDPARADVEEIRRNAERATELTRQLLAFSRRQVLQPRVLDLREVVVGIEPMLRRLLGEHIRLRIDVEHPPGNVEADPSQIEQVIMNLAVNARDAMPEGGQLTLRLDEVEITAEEAASYDFQIDPGAFVRLTAADTGQGMDPRTLDQIFEPFFTTKRPNQGTGLGLATVFGIVKQSGGYVWVDSRPGEGSTFEVLLPRVDKPVSPGRRPAGATPPLADGVGRILLVEDDDAVRALAERVLRRHGYTVDAAESGPAALERVECGDIPRPDVLVTDVVLPDMSGPDLARRLAERWPGIPVVFMSGYTEDEVIRQDLASGSDVFLPKPFTPAALARTVREVLDRAEPVP